MICRHCKGTGQAPLGKKAQQVLRVVERGGGVTKAELRERLGMSTNGVAEPLRVLLRRGLVRRVAVGHRDVRWYPGDAS